MNVFKRLATVTAALALLALPAGTAHAGTGGQLRIEKAWYDGNEITFLQPSVFSADPNGGVLACFGLTRRTDRLAGALQRPSAASGSTAASTERQARPSSRPDYGIHRRPVLGGLINEYHRAA